MNVTAALMLKAPRPGMVKTRLALDVGAEQAAAIYRSLAENQIRQIPADWRCAIHFAPQEAEDEMRAWLGPIAPAQTIYRPQPEGDLGARMHHAVQTELATSAEAVVLLGGDCPDINTAVLRDVEARLSKADAVIAPASDGGYVLLALKSDYPELFEDIAWSTAEVLTQTLASAHTRGLSVSITETFQDVDDLKSFQHHYSRSDATP
jgi:hypothetical protein